MTTAEPAPGVPVLSDAEKRANRRFVIAFGVVIGVIILSITATFYSLRATARDMRAERDTIAAAFAAVSDVPRPLDEDERDAIRHELSARNFFVRFAAARAVVHSAQFDQYYEVSLAPTDTAWTVRRVDKPALFDDPAQP